MVCITGDIHGNIAPLEEICEKNQLTENDIVIVVGDAGLNFFLDERDTKKKERLAQLKPTFFFVHGNHEERPFNIPNYKEKTWKNGKVYVEDEYPNLLFAQDGEYFEIEGMSYLVLGGAYSVDKWTRIQLNLPWYKDEQMTPEMMKHAIDNIERHNFKADIVLSHTCPYKFEPKEKYSPLIDQNSVDKTTEFFLDAVEKKLNYEKWICGHWHINKEVNDKFIFIYDKTLTIETSMDNTEKHNLSY